MEITTLIYFFLSSLILSLSLLFSLRRKANRKLNLPPSPPGRIPVIGHLHLLKPPIYRTFNTLSQKLGPIFSLQLGNRLVYIVSSPSIVEECFTKHDIILANRPRSIVGKHIGYNYSTMVGAPYGDLWRNLRRIAAIEIFSSNRLNSFLSIRKDEIRRLIMRLSRDSSESFVKVEMKSVFLDLTFNSIMRMIAGKRYYGDGLSDENESSRVRELMAEVLASGGSGNRGDYLPVLNLFSSYEKRVKKLGRRMDLFLQSLIDEHRNKEEKGNTMIDHLLSLQESESDYFTDQIFKGLMLTLVLGGTDSSATSLEWALSNLLNHPDVLNKAKIEIHSVIGQDRLINESDISNLPYLQNIINETFRLNPTAPILAPHMASEDCKIAGYDVPRNTIVLVNVWAIHRDPTLWTDSTNFVPERFDNEGEVKKLISFGLGRRACPGEGLARRIIGLTLGSLIQCFEWKRISEEKVDMSEGIGVTMPKAKPLEALCKAYPMTSKFVSEFA